MIMICITATGSPLFGIFLGMSHTVSSNQKIHRQEICQNGFKTLCNTLTYPRRKIMVACISPQNKEL